MTTCPHCNNPIYDDDALLCHFCGNSLQRPSRGAMGRLRYANKWVVWTVVGLALTSFLLLALF